MCTDMSLPWTEAGWRAEETSSQAKGRRKISRRDPSSLGRQEKANGNANKHFSRLGGSSARKRQGVHAGKRAETSCTRLQREAISCRTRDGERLGWSRAQPSARSNRVRRARPYPGHVPWKHV